MMETIHGNAEKTRQHLFLRSKHFLMVQYCNKCLCERCAATGMRMFVGRPKTRGTIRLGRFWITFYIWWIQGIKVTTK